MLLHHVQTAPVPPSQVSELPIPRPFEQILMACLEKDSARLPSSAVVLDEQLSRVPGDQPWTPGDARDWWETHAPDAVARRI
jgi:serine/threonine-protein kinase